MSGPTNGRVTVVIPTHNRADLLTCAIESVLSQTAADRCDIVVVDDGSTDQTPEVAARFARQVHYVRQSNRGVSAARNAGILTLPNEYVAFLDSDDVWMPDKIGRQLEAMQRWPDIALVAGHTLERHVDGAIRPHQALTVPEDQPFDLLPALLEQNIFPTPAVMVRSRCLRETGLFHTGLDRSEDWHLWLRLAACGPGVMLAPPPVATYAVGAPLSLSTQREALVLGGIRAFYLLRSLLQRRPDCRRRWRVGLARQLATARDLAFRNGHFAPALGYGIRSLAQWPWSRPRWEWSRTFDALLRALRKR